MKIPKVRVPLSTSALSKFHTEEVNTQAAKDLYRYP